jgi:hypothetical protein
MEIVSNLSKQKHCTIKCTQSISISLKGIGIIDLLVNSTHKINCKGIYLKINKRSYLNNIQIRVIQKIN